MSDAAIIVLLAWCGGVLLGVVGAIVVALIPPSAEELGSVDRRQRALQKLRQVRR